MNIPSDLSPQDDPVLERIMAICSRLFALSGEDEIYRVLVEEIRQQLDIDRAAIWMCDPDKNGLHGTYGTDESGQTRDERKVFHSFEQIIRHSSAVEGQYPTFIQLHEETAATGLPSYRHLEAPLNNERMESVGRGEQVVAAIWDGRHTLGTIHCDNLLRKHAFLPRQIHAIRILSLVLGQIISRNLSTQTVENERQMLADLANSMPDAVVVLDEKGRYLFANDAKFHIAPYHSLDEIAGKKTSDFYPPEIERTYLARHRQVMASGKPLRDFNEVSIPVKGEKNLFMESLFPLRSSRGQIRGIISVHKNITHLKEAERALAQSETLFRSVWMKSQDAMRLTDQNGVVLAVNPAFCELYELTPEAILQRPLGSAYSMEDAENSLRGYLARFENDETETQPVVLRKILHNGTPIDIEVMYSRFELPPGEVRYLTIIRNIGERIRQQQEMLQWQKHLLANQRLESLGIMAGGLAHDFNNMLTGILGNTGLALLNLPTTSLVREDLLKVEDLCLLAAERCRQLLAFSGQGRFEIKEHDLNFLIQDSRQFFSISIPGHLSFDCQPGTPLPAIEADEAQIRQLILNLLVNAAEAIGDAPGRICIATAFEEVPHAVRRRSQGGDLLAAGPHVSMRVTDTGCGIKPHILAKIFDPFFTTKFTGRGLGLAAVLGIVRGHRAALDVESQPGEGSSFTIYFPPAAQPAANEPPARPAGPPKIEGLSLEILIVDDEPTIRSLASKILTLAGHRVLAAEDGLAAMEIYQQKKDSIQLILLDLTMPRMDGHQVLRAVREINPHIPVLVMSGYSERELADHFEGVTPTGFIQKPFNIPELLQNIQSCIT